MLATPPLDVLHFTPNPLRASIGTLKECVPSYAEYIRRGTIFQPTATFPPESSPLQPVPREWRVTIATAARRLFHRLMVVRMKSLLIAGAGYGALPPSGPPGVIGVAASRVRFPEGGGRSPAPPPVGGGVGGARSLKNPGVETWGSPWSQSHSRPVFPFQHRQGARICVLLSMKMQVAPLVAQ